MNKLRHNPVWEFIKQHRVASLLVCLLLVLPLLAAFVQCSSIPKFIPMDSGDFVAYYGLVGSIFWTVFAFVLQRDDMRASREKEYEPVLEADVCASGDSIKITLFNAGLHGVRSIRFDGDPVASYIPSENRAVFEIGLARDSGGLCTDQVRTISETEQEIGRNFHPDMKVNSDGYPERIVCSVVDLLGRKWTAGFVYTRVAAQRFYVAQPPMLSTEAPAASSE